MMAKRINNKGSILVMAVVISLIASFAGVSFLTFAVMLHNRISDEISSQQAIYDRTAHIIGGILRGIGGHLNGLIDTDELSYGPSASLEFGYAGSSSDKVSKSERGSKPEKPMMTERRGSFADFLLLSNKERDPVRGEIIAYWTPDTIDGPVHSNDTIYIDANNDRPVFRNRVTTSANCIYPPWTHARFMQGRGYRPRIEFPDQAQGLRESSEYNWGTQGNDSLTQIVLSGNQIYYRKCGKVLVNGTAKIHCTPDYIGDQFISVPPNGALFVNGKVWISASRGRIDRMDGPYPESSMTDGNIISLGFSGVLTIGASDTMVIVDNLIYQHSLSSYRNYRVPSTMDSCSDILGLVSENYIMMGRLAPGTLYVNAAMAAIRGAISVEDIYYYQAPGWDNEKQALSIWGSIAQRNRGIIHTNYPTGHLRGFVEKDYHYDVRFAHNRPPFFPETGSSGIMRMLEMPESD